MALEFPSPTVPAASRTEVFTRYLDYFRSQLISKIESLPADARRASSLPSGWTPLELLRPPAAAAEYCGHLGCPSWPPQR